MTRRSGPVERRPDGSGQQDELTAEATWAALLGGPPLQPDELRALTALAQSRHVAAGEVVLSHCQAAHALVVLAAGEVALGLRTPDGMFRTERIVRGPAWLDQS